MYIQVKTMDDKRKENITISKMMTIKELKCKIAEIFEVTEEKQRLFFRGKQLENEYKLVDYNVNLNDVVQLMIKADLDFTKKDEDRLEKKDEKTEAAVSNENDPEVFVVSKYYKVGDIIDVKHPQNGSWCEGQIEELVKEGKNKPQLSPAAEEEPKAGEKEEEDNIRFKVKCLSDETKVTATYDDIRPRAVVLIPYHSMKIGDKVVVNYNIEQPDKPGHWYTAHVSKLSHGRRPQLTVSLLISFGRGAAVTQLDNCNIKFINKVFQLEEPKPISQRTTQDDFEGPIPERNLTVSNCDRCNDDPWRKCRECSCAVCGGKEDPGKQIMCDECDYAYHIWCLNPPLESIPDEDEWYCSNCKNDENEIVKAGEGLKFSKKRMKLKCFAADTKRDWGKGMACAGRTKSCSIVPANHFGPIPGVEVGTCWKYRLQVAEAGVHRPVVAGISGRATEGSFSLALSGGYEDDVDHGDWFMYTGSGGRDLSGNKRTAEQSCNQTLTRFNLALAMNCNAPINAEKGAKSQDWQKGKPVRVVRNYKLRKHSDYAPEEGNRYDGIYKVVKYFPVKGKSGFIIWRYELRRDDPTPAPWTAEGKKWIEMQGLEEILYPDGYLENKLNNSEVKSTKRVLGENSETQTPPRKKAKKVTAYEISEELRKCIAKDKGNSKLWDTALLNVDKGKQAFLSEVETSFTCICCQEVVNKPVSTPCNHNICKDCLARSFKADVYTCPYCRYDLTKDYKTSVNNNLQKVLVTLFPGYNLGR